jgi:AICAR transformylase/IMP cyclohydrolase PurH
LKFREGLKKQDKANTVDQFLLWDELSRAERDQMMSSLEEEPTPITAEERLEWVKRFDGVSLSSDAYIPFRDNLDRASRSNVRWVAHTGGSVRDAEVAEAAAGYGMTVITTGVRLFLH